MMWDIWEFEQPSSLLRITKYNKIRGEEVKKKHSVRKQKMKTSHNLLYILILKEEVNMKNCAKFGENIILEIFLPYSNKNEKNFRIDLL